MDKIVIIIFMKEKNLIISIIRSYMVKIYILNSRNVKKRKYLLIIMSMLKTRFPHIIR